ncbi:MAG: GDP-mannose 4,6-dehydratase [Acidobacteriota bacterium]
MKLVVTGAAGFIGSHLCERLVIQEHKVIGIDSFNDFYSRKIKENNINILGNNKNFDFIEGDINKLNLTLILKETEAVFHLAAQAGVRSSWGESFTGYTRDNIDATQKLLESAKKATLKKFIYASSSSVYGSCPELPMKETSPCLPYSPYGVTKLAAEHLCLLYYKNYRLPCVSLRFFTVYGPRQRPDMAFHKFLKAACLDKPIQIYGDGNQTRDFTYISDIVDANVAAFYQGIPGEIYNVGGGEQKKLNDVLRIIEKVTGKNLNIQKESRQEGDVPHTLASIEKARSELSYKPHFSLESGLRAQWHWIQQIYSPEIEIQNMREKI